MSHIYYTEQVHNYHKVQDFRGNLTAASGTVLSMISQVRSPKLTVVFSQSPYMLMAYRVVGTAVRPSSAAAVVQQSVGRFRQRRCRQAGFCSYEY